MNEIDRAFTFSSQQSSLDHQCGDSLSPSKLQDKILTLPIEFPLG